MTRAASFSELEALKNRFPLVDYVAGYVPLERAGQGKYRACCPFHQEDTPSFYVFEGGTFKCFGCGAGGDLFSFVQKIEGLEFREAKNKLARGDTLTPLPLVHIPRLPSKPETTWKQEVKRAGVSPLAGTPGERYLSKRGIPLETALAARVKFAASWYKHPSVLFPIVGQDGATVAVQGRAIKGGNKITKGPKSLGVFVTAGALRDGGLVDGVAICEAPIDALSLLVLKGIPAIATCGSGIPLWVPGAARGRVYIATDSDKQGDHDFLEWGKHFEAHRITPKRLRPFFKDWNLELQRSLQQH